jgi:hypothetical protein
VLYCEQIAIYDCAIAMAGYGIHVGVETLADLSAQSHLKPLLFLELGKPDSRLGGVLSGSSSH